MQLNKKGSSLANLVWRNLPCRRGALHMLRRLGRPSAYKRLYFEGPFQVPIDGQHSFAIHQNNRYGIETELFWRGLEEGWESASINVWIKLCQYAQVILDIGAAEGLYTLVTGSIRPEACLLAFEPVPQSAVELRRNLAINESGARCFQTAVSDYEGEALFIQPSAHSNEGYLAQSAAQGAGITVQVTTVERIFQREQLRRLDLLKIDVEGAEPEVLMGMGSLLARFKPSMLIEVLSDEAGHEIERQIEGLGYLFFDINDDNRNGPCDLRRVDHIRKGRCLNYLLVQPEIARQIGIG